MNKELLYYEMSKKKKSVSEICHEIGISKSAFYCKISGKTQFTLPEMRMVVSILELDSPVAIFFAD